MMAAKPRAARAPCTACGFHFPARELQGGVCPLCRAQAEPVQRARKATAVPTAPSPLEATLDLLIRVEGLPAPQPEYRGLAPRMFRFDRAWPELRIAVECEGGTWQGSRGRHTSGAGYENDCEKYSLAAIAGWIVLRFTGAMLDDGRARELLLAAWAARHGPMTTREAA